MIANNFAVSNNRNSKNNFYIPNNSNSPQQSEVPIDYSSTLNQRVQIGNKINPGHLLDEINNKYRDQITQWQSGWTGGIDYNPIIFPSNPANRDLLKIRNASPTLAYQNYKDQLENAQKNNGFLKIIFENLPAGVPSSLVDEKNLNTYKDEVVKSIEEFRLLEPKTKDNYRNFAMQWVRRYQQTLNKIFITELKVPPPKLNFIPSKSLDDPTWAEFFDNSWTIDVCVDSIFDHSFGLADGIDRKAKLDRILFDENTGLIKTPQDALQLEEKFRELAGTIYHEYHHPEEYYKTLLWALKINSDLNINLIKFYNNLTICWASIVNPASSTIDQNEYNSTYIEIKDNETQKIKLENEISNLEASMEKARQDLLLVERLSVKTEKYIKYKQAQKDRYEISYQEFYKKLNEAKNKKQLLENQFISSKSKLLDLEKLVLIRVADNIQPEIEAYFKAYFELKALTVAMDNITKFTSNYSKSIFLTAIQEINKPNILSELHPMSPFWMEDIFYFRQGLTSDKGFEEYITSLIEKPAFEIERKLHNKINEVFPPKNLSDIYSIGLEKNNTAKALITALTIIKEETITLDTLLENFDTSNKALTEETRIGYKRRLNSLRPSGKRFQEILDNIEIKYTSSIPKYDEKQAVIRGKDLGYLDKNEGYFSLDEIFGKLSASEDFSENFVYAMASNKHIMVLAKKNDDFYFYDPQENRKICNGDINIFEKELIEYFNRERRSIYNIKQRGIGIETSEFKLINLQTVLTSLENEQFTIGGREMTAQDIILTPHMQNHFTTQNRRGNDQNGIGDGECFWKSIGVVLSKNVERYLKNLKEIETSKDAEVRIFESVSRVVHEYLNEEYGLKKEDLKYSIDEVIEEIRKSNKEAFKLGGKRHALSIVAKPEEGIYELFDFDGNALGNATVITASSLEEFRTKLKSYFSESRLSLYGIDSRKPLFEFKEINKGYFGNIPVKINVEGGEIFVGLGEIASTENLKGLINDGKKRRDETNKMVHELEAAGITDFALEMAEKLQQGVEILFKEHSENYGFSSKTHTVDLTGSTPPGTVKLIAIEDPTAEPIYVKTSDRIFERVKEFINKSTRIMEERYNRVTGQFHVEHATIGMNTAFALQQFIQWYYRDKTATEEEQNISAGLALAVKAHMVLNLAQLTQGVTEDAKEMGQLYKALKNGLSETEEVNSGLIRSIGKIGTLLNIGMIGLDVYELTQAKDSYMQATFGTQLGFDVATTLVGLICGPLTVPMSGLAVGASGLVESYNELRKQWSQVGEYFAQVDRAYKKGYEYNSKDNTLKFLTGGVIRRLDLTKTEGQIEFDTQYLYTAPSKAYGRIADDVNNDDGTKDNTIPLREAIGRAETVNIDKDSLASETILLPGTPKSYIGWSRGMYASFRDNHGTGYDDGIIKRIEKYSKEHAKNGHIFRDEIRTLLFDKFIYQLWPSAQSTEIDIVLDKKERVLIMAKETDTPWRKSRYSNEQDYERDLLHYNIVGNGGKYIISLNKTGSLHLSSQAQGTQWILDARQLGNQALKIEDGKITIGGVTIEIDSRNRLNNSKLQIIRNEETIEVDLNNNNLQTLSADAALWNNNHKQTIDDYLNQEARQNHLLGHRYIPISNYDHKNDIWPQGNAYYDVEQKRMLFTLYSRANDATAGYGKILTQGELGTVTGEDIYFYHNYDATSKDKVNRETASYIWRVDAKSMELKDFYILPTTGAEDKIQMWQENGKVFFSREGTEKNKQSIFTLDETIQLAGHKQPVEDVTQINSASTYGQAPFEKMKHYQIRGNEFELSTSKQITHAPLITIYGTDKQGKTYRYWVKTEPGALMKQLITPNLPDTTPGTAEHLAFCHTMENKYFFFDPVGKALYLQSGAGNLTPTASTIKASKISVRVSNVYSIGENLYALTAEGLINRVDKNGKLTLESLSENWLKAQGKEWIKNLKAQFIVNDRPLHLYGLKGADKKPLLAWYYQEKLIFSPNLLGNKLQFIKADEKDAYLFDAEKGKFYKQAIISDASLSTAFGSDYSLLGNHSLPTARELFLNQQFKSVSQGQNGTTRFVTQDGAILEMDSSEKLSLVGLDKTWLTHHENDKNSAIAELIKKWPSAISFLPIESSNPQESKWYDRNSGRFISVPLPSSDQPQYLGLRVTKNAGGSFLETSYIHTNKGLKSFSFAFEFDFRRNQLVSILREQKPLGPLKAYRIDDTIIIKGSSANDTLKPLCAQNVKKTVFYGSGGEDTYIIKKEDRENIKYFTINNFDKDKKKNKLQLELKDYYSTRLSRRDNNLIIADQKGIVEIENIFGSGKDDYNHLDLELTFENNPSIKKNYQLSDLFNQIQDPSFTFYSNSILPLPALFKSIF